MGLTRCYKTEGFFYIYFSITQTNYDRRTYFFEYAINIVNTVSVFNYWLHIKI